ncbi:TPA: protein mom [Escherichia coli]|nr:protein mom [Escherichia coli]
MSARGFIKSGEQVVGYGCDELYVATIDCWLARLVISTQHYSHRFVNNSYLHLGVFAGRDHLVGVLQFGYAMNPSSGGRVVSGTGNRECMELNRMWLHDSQPRNTESRVISYSLRYIRHVFPAVHWIQSFADERCGRAGVVYQAANFDYVGSHTTEFYELDGEFYHRIAMTCKGRRGGVRGDYLKENKERAKKVRLNQFRYIYFLDKRSKAKLNTKLFKIQPPPKPLH